MTTLDLKAAFFHVIDDHRWLSASGCAWNLVGPGAPNGTKKIADEMLPNIEVMVLDSLLLHARSLIDFYTKCQQTRSTDVLLRDFNISIGQGLRHKLVKYKKPIEVHLLHLTDSRDSDHRKLHATGKGAKNDRPDWNHEAVPIVGMIFDALKEASNQSGNWQQPFKELYDASNARYLKKLYPWPNHLCEKAAVEQYLRSLGL